MYKLTIKSSAKRDTKSLSKEGLEKIDREIKSLKINPLPPGVKKIKKGKKLHYRIRKGNFRIGYQLNFSERKVTIVYLKRRSEATYK